MQAQLQTELFLHYPKFFRPPGKCLIDPDVISELENSLLDDMTPFDERGIECGNGWFALIDRLSRACENEIDTLIAQGVHKEGSGHALPRSRKNSVVCVFTCTARYRMTCESRLCKPNM
jgi:hypothetical protein